MAKPRKNKRKEPTLTAQKSRMITASEIARHLYCARALIYDHRYPDERNGSFFNRLNRWLRSPLKMGGTLVIFGGLGWYLNLFYALIIYGTSLVLLIFMQWLWRRVMFPSSVVIYHGTKARCNQKMLAAPNLGLSGKLDCLLEHEGYAIPILRKTSPAPQTPHHAHIMQLIAHCLLVAQTRDNYPPYGVIQYGDGRTFEVDFDEDSVEALSKIMDEIEANHQREEVPISHQDRGRCYACSHRKRCNQSLFT